MLFRVYVLDKPHLLRLSTSSHPSLDVTGLRDAKHPVAHSGPGPMAGTANPWPTSASSPTKLIVIRYQCCFFLATVMIVENIAKWGSRRPEPRRQVPIMRACVQKRSAGSRPEEGLADRVVAPVCRGPGGLDSQPIKSATSAPLPPRRPECTGPPCRRASIRPWCWTVAVGATRATIRRAMPMRPLCPEKSSPRPAALAAARTRLASVCEVRPKTDGLGSTSSG